jgi:hypothetical protein
MAAGIINHTQALDEVIATSRKDNAKHWNAHGAVKEARQILQVANQQQGRDPAAFSAYKAYQQVTIIIETQV